MIGTDAPLWLQVISTSVVPLIVVVVGAGATVRLSQARWKAERLDLEGRWKSDRADLERRWAEQRHDADWVWRREELRDLIGVCVSRFGRVRATLLVATGQFSVAAALAKTKTPAEIETWIEAIDETEREQSAASLLLVLADDPLNAARAAVERDFREAKRILRIALLTAAGGSTEPGDSATTAQDLKQIVHALVPLEGRFIRLAGLSLDGLDGAQQNARLEQEMPDSWRHPVTIDP